VDLIADIFGSPWPHFGICGSLRRRVRREVREHLDTNDVLRENRNSPGVRFIAKFLQGRSLAWFLRWYFVFALVLGLAEIAMARYFPTLLPKWSEADERLWGFLKDAESYLLGTQVTLIGLIFPIAVGLVTLIVQRQQTSNTSAHVQIYYQESFAYGVGASGIALVIVGAIQLFWPVQFLIHRIGWGTPNMLFKMVAVAVHCGWLTINAASIWHFLAVSLDFVHPDGRAALRRRYSARVSIPYHLYDDLMGWFYRNAAETLLPEAREAPGPSLLFGVGNLLEGPVEVTTELPSDCRLTDVWMRPLSVALRLWWRRTVRRGLNTRQRLQRVTLTFAPDTVRPFRGKVDLAQRSGGAPFTGFERLLIRVSFRFKRIRSS
jgi:hypothetical protein